MTLAPPTAAPLSGRGLLLGLRAITQDRTPQRALTSFLVPFQGAQGALVAATGRTALFLILRQLKQAVVVKDPRRSSVILPAYTCPSLGNVVLEAGLTLRIVDVDPTTLEYVPELLDRAADDRTLALVLVHPLGLVKPVEPAASIARRSGAVLIEDIAQTFGAKGADGRRAGTGGDFAFASFGPGKPISAGGGGVLFANSPASAVIGEEAWRDLPMGSRASSTVAWGRALTMDLIFRSTGWWVASQLGIDRLGNRESALGFQASQVRGLTNAQAALALDGLGRLDDYVAARRRHAAFLFNEVVEHPHLKPIGGDPLAGQASYLRFPVLAATGSARDRVYEQLQGAGIGAGKLYPKTMADLFPSDGGPYPGADQLVQRLLTLPTHPRLTGSELNRLAVGLRSTV